MSSKDPQPPYFTGTPEQLPPRRDNTTKIVLLIVGGVMLTVLIACAGFLGLGYWAARGVYQSTLEGFEQAYSAQLKEELGPDMEKVEAEVGEIQRISYDITRSVQETTDRVDVDVYEISGTTGSGEVIVRERVSGEETATQIVTLYLDDGRELLIREKEVERPADEVTEEAAAPADGEGEAAPSAEGEDRAAAPAEGTLE